MTTSLLWYLLAGILLGFAASTLWEWLYFRRKRMKLDERRVQELEAQLADERALNAQLRLAQEELSGRTAPAYASPGVFLDSESERVQTQPAPDTIAGGSPARSTAAEYSAPTSSVADATVGAQNTPTATPAATPASTSGTPQNARAVAVAASQADGANADADRHADRYVDALAVQEDDEDDVSTLERLAAELAQSPQEAVPPPAPAARNAPVTRSKNYPDNLSLIKGIGDVYKFRLYSAGIFTWHQLAETDVETLRTATNAYPGSNVDEWGEQARALAEKHGREDAYYTGPVPDDLTEIIGIGPVGERTLYRAGICTYSQLAGATVAELQSLFPVAIAGDEPNFSQWIRLAIDLANRKDKA
jgi:predicted flap endonuclease-1-like 5' DNA nuclease